MVQGDMTTKEIIDELRDQADVIGPGTECNLLHSAADRLEAIEERVAIMQTEHEAELNTALKALEESVKPYPCDYKCNPCDEMCGNNDTWCIENCKPEYHGATAKCWKRYLYEWKAEKGGKE